MPCPIYHHKKHNPKQYHKNTYHSRKRNTYNIIHLFIEYQGMGDGCVMRTTCILIIYCFYNWNFDKNIFFKISAEFKFQIYYEQQGYEYLAVDKSFHTSNHWHFNCWQPFMNDLAWMEVITCWPFSVKFIF